MATKTKRDSERLADKIAREADEKAVAEKRKRAANQAAELERADGLARDKAANVFGRAIADRIQLDSTYMIFTVRGVALAITLPSPTDRPKDRLLVGHASPVFHASMRLQGIAGVGVDPPRLLQGARLSHDAADSRIAAVDPDDEQLRQLIGKPRR